MQILIGMLATVLFARILHKDGIGQYDLFYRVSLLAVTVAAMGFGNASVFFINNQKIPRIQVATDALKFSSVMGLVLSAAMGLSYLAFKNYFGAISVPTGVIYALGTGAMLVAVLMRASLVANFRAREMAVLDVLQPTVLLLCGGALAVTKHLTTESAMIVFILGHAVTGVVTLFYVGGDIHLALPFDWQLFKKMISYGLKLAAANLLYLLLASLSVMLLRYIHEDSFDAVGLYGRAMNVTLMTVLVPMAMGPLLMARWAGLSGQGMAHQVEMAARLFATYGAAAAVAMSVLGKLLLTLLYTREFATPEAVRSLQILSISAATIAVSGVYADFLAGMGKAIYTTLSLTAAAIVTGVLCLCLIPKYWITGAAVATLAGNVVNLCICAIVCRRLYGVRPSHSWRLTGEDVRYVWRSLFRRSGAAEQPTEEKLTILP
jgi:O-antigen/teichoic acid export membrane protein